MKLEVNSKKNNRKSHKHMEIEKYSEVRVEIEKFLETRMEIECIKISGIVKEQFLGKFLALRAYIKKVETPNKLCSTSSL